MKQWGMKSLATKGSLLALAGIFAVGVVACGGGGGTPISTSTGSDTIAGSAIKGPLTGSTITYNGSVQSGKSPSHGSYSFTTTRPTSATTAYPLTFSGGTDDVTGATPIMDLSTLVTSTTTTLNANAITTMIAAAAQANVGTGGTITLTAISTVKDIVIRTFGFGVDGVASGASTFDPFSVSTSSLTSQQAGEYAMALEASGEMLRRIQAANTSWSMATIISNLGTELKGGALPTTATNAAFYNALQISAAAISNEVVNRSLTVGSNGISLTAIATAYGSYLGGVTPLLTSALASTSAFLAAQVKTLWSAAAAILGTTSTDGAKYLAAAAALSTTSTLANLQAQIASTIGTSTSALAATVIATYAQQSATAAAATAAAAAAAANKATVVMVDGSTSGMPSVTDYGQTSAYTLTSGGLAAGATTGAPSVLTLNLASTTGTISAANLTSLMSTSAVPTGATDPTINFKLSNVPTSSGTATVTLLLKDGSSSTWTSGQRSLSVSYKVNYSGDGKTLTLTVPASSTASVTYYNSTATSASTATLSNAVADQLLVVSGGISNNQQSSTLKAKIFALFTNSTFAALLNNGATAAGSYFYQVKVVGMPLGWDANANGTIADSGDGLIDTVQGTFTVK
ncbi:MAG: hypothetical protein HQL66_01160 [Magnetococcales bacterium]|nr:hypothetical protein [Magnetococcales bacterium]